MGASPPVLHWKIDFNTPVGSRPFRSQDLILAAFPIQPTESPMNYLKTLTLTGLLLICTTHLLCAQQPHASTGSPSAGGDFVSLLRGDMLDGWHGDNPHTTAKSAPADRARAIADQQAEFAAHWRVEQGELINDGHGPYATTDKDYGDVELLVDYRTVALADSGIYLRGTPQIQIWDTTQAGGKWDRHADRGSGGLFNNRPTSPGQLPLVLADKPFGDWNQFRIVQIGSRTWVELNHKLVVDGAIMENYWDKERRLPLPVSGPIHLQTHGGEIRWRNLAVREIGNDEALSRLRGDDAKYGFTSMFNGKDLSGWRGDTEDYAVVDGAIVCQPGKGGGVLFTDEQYDDFVVRLEFKLPPAGNNGLAIRYPGTGRAAYDGMCELQVLDDGAVKYVGHDPRQSHGAVYGIAPAHRGYLRPTGQWNYQEVTVKGSAITVELNGTVIVDTDVSQITQFKDDRAHPGLNLKRGHFGFAGHKDPVMFRNIAIKRLPVDDAAAKTTATANMPQPIFHASFDGSTDANLTTGSGKLHIAKTIDRKEMLDDLKVARVSIARGKGRYGDALRFSAKTKEVVFYEGIECGYQPRDWSGSVSVWLKLDPNQDLEPGFCDPLQITERAWNDAAFFVDFDKDLPRDFRLGVFADLKTWNPREIEWEQFPVAERPMVVVKQPPFSSSEWTHVCFTWSDVNSATDSAAKSDLYLNGEHQGTYARSMKFTWDPQQAAIMLGLNYIGLMDDLIVFPATLSAEQVQQLTKHPVGGLKQP